MRLLAAALLILAGVLGYGLGEIAASINVTRPPQAGYIPDAGVRLQNISEFLGGVGCFLFPIEYIVNLAKKSKESAEHRG